MQTSVSCRVVQCSCCSLHCWVSSPCLELVDCMKVHAPHWRDVGDVAGSTQCMLLYRFHAALHVGVYSHLSSAESLDGLGRCNALMGISFPCLRKAVACRQHWLLSLNPCAIPHETACDSGAGRGLYHTANEVPCAAILTQVLMPCLACYRRRQRWPPACS